LPERATATGVTAATKGLPFGWPAGAPSGYVLPAKITTMEEDRGMRVTLTEPGIAGSYEVVERREDGTLVLRPDERWPETEERARELAERHRETLDFLADH
jgi:hypothetical protein